MKAHAHEMLKMLKRIHSAEYKDTHSHWPDEEDLADLIKRAGGADDL